MLRRTMLAARFFVVGAATAFAVATCGGKVVVDQGNAQGGSGGSTDSSNTTVDTGPVPDGPGPMTSVGPGPSVTVGGSTSSGPMTCLHCADFLSSRNPESDLCPGSAPLYDQLTSCICSVCVEPCQGACSGRGPTTDECQECAKNAFAGPCSAAFTDCANDTG